jgi:hypothetical protein
MSQIGRLPGIALLTAALVAASLACGHRGDPLPPRRRTPPGLAEFRLAQRGQALEVSLLTPAASVDGIAYERLVVEILFAEGEKDLEKAGERREVQAYARQRVVESLPLPAPGTIARAAARGIAGREKGPRTLTLALIAQSPVAAPRELRARLVKDGVRLDWAGELPTPVAATVLPPRMPGLPGPPPTPGSRPSPKQPPDSAVPPAATPQAAAPPAAPGQPEVRQDLEGDAPKATTVEPRKAGFYVYRRVGTESYRLPLTQEPLAEPSVRDNAAPEGRTVCYVVRAAASVDPLVESAASNEACLEVRDIQPPEAPTGTAVLPRDRGLEVLWTPSPEDDLAGYRVYRQAPGEPRSRVAEVEAARSAWLDTTARPGVVYQYEVTAFDRAGNESAPAPATEASLP